MCKHILHFAPQLQALGVLKIAPMLWHWMTWYPMGWVQTGPSCHGREEAIRAHPMADREFLSMDGDGTPRAQSET
jgi:hypothetical protein